jgi:hypothetical protein
MVFFVLELGDYLDTLGVKHRITHKRQYLNARKLWTGIATQLVDMMYKGTACEGWSEIS